MATLSRSLTIVLLASAIGVLAGAASPSLASAQRQNKIDTIRVDIHADLGWWWAFGTGFRLDIPLVADGFIDRVEDEFALSVGVEAAFVNWRNDRCNAYGCWGDWSVWPHVVAQWNFYLNESWSIFPELGGAFGFHDCGPADDRGVCPTGSPVIGFGARWHFAPPRVALLFRLIYPFGGQIGINF
jgi:hypothetical protein